ncbi:MAG: hypothetical protein ABA06_02260 [Parcubacteria bacterium C7867-001]|nr:MAG: hypothetical protein ABA06_02260 [Parcubacteria bacterium C7867-001]
MYVRVRVIPDAKRESLIETEDRTLTVAVKQPAERNLANTRVRELLAEHFSLPLGKVRLTSGHRSPRKIFDIEM